MMRTYRETFVSEDGRRGLTQEELLQRMALVDSDYGERFSHATVSRWESGATRPTVQRLRAFGKALDLAANEVAGLMLLAELAPDLPAALELTSSRGNGQTAGNGGAPAQESHPEVSQPAEGWAEVSASSNLRDVARFVLFRFLPLGIGIVVGGYALSFLGLEDAWTPVVYMAFATVLVFVQGFLLPDRSRSAGFRELFWVSLFFLLSTPLLQFAPIEMDHYSLHLIVDSTDAHVPYMLALLINLTLASSAGLMFQLLWKWQQRERGGGKGSALQRAAWVVVPPVGFVYSVVIVISNVSIWIQFAVLMPAVAASFTAFLLLRDPSIRTSERDRQFLQWLILALGFVGSTLGLITVLAIYISPDLPTVLPDHNLLRSWEIDFAQLGFSREEALDRLNLGYMFHAMSAFAYVLFVIGGNLLAAIYRLGNRDG